MKHAYKKQEEKISSFEAHQFPATVEPVKTPDNPSTVSIAKGLSFSQIGGSRLQMSSSKELDLLALAVSKKQLRMNLKSQILLSGDVDTNTEIEGHESNEQKLSQLKTTSRKQVNEKVEARGGVWELNSDNALEYSSYWLERIERCLGASSIEAIQRVGYYWQLGIDGQEWGLEQKDFAHLSENWKQIFLSESAMFGKVYEDVELDEEILDFHHLIVDNENSAVNYDKFDISWYEEAYSPHSYERLMASRFLDK